MINTPLRLAGFCSLLLILVYFGFPSVSPAIKNSSENRTKSLDVTGLENLEQEYYPQLTPNQKAELGEWNKKLKNAAGDSAKSEIMKSISAFWFDLDIYSIAGSYARKVAEIEKSETAWQIAGTTFLYGLDKEADPKKKLFCQQAAVYCLEQAISLNTAEPSYQLYRALAYVKLPGDDPMKGIKMMLSMEDQFPEYLPLQIQLAELGIGTGQYEKAKARLDQVLLKDPNHNVANCLMVTILEKLNKAEEAKKYQLNCK